MTATTDNTEMYDRFLVSDMLGQLIDMLKGETPSYPYTIEAVEEQCDLLRAADNAESRADTVSLPAEGGGVSQPQGREAVASAIQHLSNWLDTNECECESGHRCGRDDVQRTVDDLRRITPPAPAGEAVRGRLIECRNWFDTQAKSISKGNGSTWDLMQVREQRELCEAALAAQPGAGDGFVQIEASWLKRMQDFIGPGALAYMRQGHDAAQAQGGGDGR